MCNHPPLLLKTARPHPQKEKGKVGPKEKVKARARGENPMVLLQSIHAACARHQITGRGGEMDNQVARCCQSGLWSGHSGRPGQGKRSVACSEGCLPLFCGAPCSVVLGSPAASAWICAMDADGKRAETGNEPRGFTLVGRRGVEDTGGRCEADRTMAYKDGSHIGCSTRTATPHHTSCPHSGVWRKTPMQDEANPPTSRFGDGDK